MCISIGIYAMGNRKAATQECLYWIDQLVPGGKAVKDMEKVLNSLSDEQFDRYMKALEDGDEIVSIAIPNLGTDKLEMERLLDLGEKLGHNFFEQLWLTDAKTGVTYLTPEKYLVLLLPLRRQQQALVKKISIPDSNKHIDELTGQVTGDSKGASLSGPEIQVLRAQGLDMPLLEGIKVRGGDEKAFRYVNRQIIETGEANIDVVLAAGTRVKGTVTLSDLLTGMHLKNNL